MRGFTFAIAAAVLQVGGLVNGAPPGIMDERGAVMLTAPDARYEMFSVSLMDGS